MSFPDALTFFRIVSIPIIFFTFFLNQNWIGTFVFVLACLTDFLDGYVARAWKQTSRFGQIFDPIADKLLIVSMLFICAGFRRISHFDLIPTLCIICREILISGVRETMSAHGFVLASSSLSKTKTTLQMLAISLILLNTKGLFLSLGIILLWIASLLSIYSGFFYLKTSLNYIKKHEY
jgi:CDP-diacylglycerol--glycerol-3-phosphate 3-phosphatidyltransferase